MEPIISQEELQKLMGVDRKVRGMGIKAHADFVLEREGEEALAKLEKAITEAGYPVKYAELDNMVFYPQGLEVATLIAIQRLFNYDEEKFEEMGKFGVKISLLVKLFMKYFISLEKLAQQASPMWKKGGDLGDLKIGHYSKEEKYIILRIENFNSHPLYCPVFRGYFSKAIEMITGKEATCQETKCGFKGGEFHEFRIEWN